ncbi:uncharacterized protein ACNLHF_002306 isoform 1-T2 [Anomaloglossus baeobatrachus]
MAEATWDEDIPLSVEESNEFIDLANKGKPEGKKDGGAETPEPIPDQVTIQMMEEPAEGQDLPETWRNFAENFREMFRIIGGMTRRLYRCCVEDPNVCESLVMLVLRCCSCMKWSCKLVVVAPARMTRYVIRTRLASSLFHSTARNLLPNNQMSRRTDPDETRRLIDGEAPEEDL